MVQASQQGAKSIELYTMYASETGNCEDISEEFLVTLKELQKSLGNQLLQVP